MNKNVVVVIGAGGIGLSIARRLGAGKTVLLADFSENVLESSRKSLTSAGFETVVQPVDISSHESVRSLAEAAARLGNVEQMVLAAGLSPQMAPPADILAVDLIGTAFVLEEFGRIVASGGSGVVVSSMAGHMLPPLPHDQQVALARVPADELGSLPFLQEDVVSDSGMAYGLSKVANHLRVQAEAISWGRRGARVNSVSPGIILTPLAEVEMASEMGPGYRRMIEASAAGRVGTVDEIASAVAYLAGSDAGFITGSDLLIDGGVIAAMRFGELAEA